jgi:hypothetical protein
MRVKMINRICIIGGGNIGLALAVEMGKNKNIEIIILTSKYKIFCDTITSIDINTDISNSTRPFLVTDDYSKAFLDVDMIFVTIPAFLIKNIISKIHLIKKTIIILTPGSGGREFYFKNLAEQGHIVAGLDRVPFVARISECGGTVMVSKKERIRYSLINKNSEYDLSSILEQHLNMKIEKITNYLNITFTPSNQILHTARLYSILLGKNINTSFSNNIKFYAEWDDNSSEYLLTADDELQKVCNAYELHDVISLRNHYEVCNSQELTYKLKSIKSLSNIYAPFIYKNNKYYIDNESRYFKEDFPFGLCIIKDFAIIGNIDTPMIDKILNWYSTFFNFDYFKNDMYTGKDLKNLPLPKNFNLNTVHEVKLFYNTIDSI